MGDLIYRRATAADREALDEMTLAGARHWGHHINHPDAYAGLANELADGPPPDESTVLVWEDGEGMAGFFELRQEDGFLDLYRFFLRTDLIGRGHGRTLWDRMVSEARELHDRLRIHSDPDAVGFYAAMGADAGRTIEMVPGFELTEFWYDLRA